jgi:hypothetical protein
VDNGEPRWDDERARSLVGKYALVGLTFLDAEGNLLSQAQRHGRVVEVDEERGISIRFVAHGRRGTARFTVCRRISARSPTLHRGSTGFGPPAR